MNLSLLTLANFRGWLQDTQAECVPCDDQKCILAKWLNDEGFDNARVDGENFYLSGHLDGEDHDEDDVMTCPRWAEAVVTQFDGMAKQPIQLHLGGQTPIGPEVYKAPLLTLLDMILQAEKGVAQAQASIEQTSLNTPESI